MNLVSVLIGLAALLGALVGFLPLLGWLNWLVIPVALVGLVIGMLARERAGRNVNAVVLAFAVVRLALGGGVL